MSSLTQFQENLDHLLKVANEFAQSHPNLMEVEWFKVHWEAVPDLVHFIVTYAPDPGQVKAQHVNFDARVVLNRDEKAFIDMCLQTME